MTKILVCGSRDYDDYDKLQETLNYYLPRYHEPIIIEGGAPGADSLARTYAQNNGITFLEVKADWKKYGKSAGPLRNTKMLEMEPDLVIAFSSKDELTPGTRDTVTKAKKLGIKVKTIYSKH